MTDTDKYITFNLIDKFEEDEFSLWTVDIKERDFKAAMEDFVRVSGDPASVLKYLPAIESEPGNVLNFAFINSTRLQIISTEVDDDFILRYHGQGCSVHGSLKEILDELINDDISIDKEIADCIDGEEWNDEDDFDMEQ